LSDVKKILDGVVDSKDIASLNFIGTI